MRLIDADELKTLSYEVLVDTGNPNRTDGLSSCNGLVEDDIDLAPTVEAIPIEWLIDYCKKRDINIRDIFIIVDDWRKDNEREKKISNIV